MRRALQVNSEQPTPHGYLVQQLRRQLGGWEAAPPEDAMFSTGAAALDQLLPGGGLRHGMLVEWLGEEWGRAAEQQSGDCRSAALPFCCSSSAAVTLSLLGAREACREGGELVVIDRHRIFYPPAAAAWGIDLDRLIIIHPRSARDELWAAVESLRSPAVAAVWGMIDRLDSRGFRRLQLAAQAGRTLGILLRPAAARSQPSWAEVRLETRQGDRETRRQGDRPVQKFSLSPPLLVSLSGFARHVRVRVLRLRGGRAGGAAMLEIDDATHTVREVEKGRQFSAVGSQPNRLAESR